MDSPSQAKVSPVGVGRDCQRSSPAKTSAYAELKPVAPIAEAMTSWISAVLGQMSRRKTGWPSPSSPIGSLARSMSIVPARAYATTSGGDAR